MDPARCARAIALRRSARMRRLRSTARLRRITNTASTPISAANQAPIVLQADPPEADSSDAPCRGVEGFEGSEVLVFPVAPVGVLTPAATPALAPATTSGLLTPLAQTASTPRFDLASFMRTGGSLSPATSRDGLLAKPWSRSAPAHPAVSYVPNTTAIMVRPSRVADAMRVRPALSVNPVLSPFAPAYPLRSVLLWLM